MERQCKLSAWRDQADASLHIIVSGRLEDGTDAGDVETNTFNSQGEIIDDADGPFRFEMPEIPSSDMHSA